MKLIKNILHLENIIRDYGKYAFTEVSIDDSMMNLIVDKFIKEKYDRNNDEKNKEITIEFMKNMKQFKDKLCDSTGKRVLGRGTYGEICELDNSKVIKTMVNNDQKKFTNNDILDENMIHEFFIVNILEFVSYVIRMAILRYIDCNVTDDQDIVNLCNQTNMNSINKDKTNEYFNLIAYSSSTGLIAKPFYIEYPDGRFSIGYKMIRYQETLTDIFKSRSNTESAKIIYKVVNVFKKIASLSNYGIVLSHRDASDKNIMTTNYTSNARTSNTKTSYEAIKLIDFGFACVYIQFEDGDSWRTGNFFDQNTNKCREPDHDVIFFILFIIIYYPSILQQLHIHDDLKLVIGVLDDDINQIRQDTSLMWLYPIWAYSPNKDINKNIHDDIIQILLKIPNITYSSYNPQQNINVLDLTKDSDAKILYEKNKLKYKDLYNL
jgi:hypothetical protein